MEFVWWLTGVCATIAACKFVIAVFRRLTSKNSMNAFLDRAEDGFYNSADRVTNYIRRKKAEKDNRPIVTIK